MLNVYEAVNTGKTKYMEIGRHRGMIANSLTLIQKKIRVTKLKLPAWSMPQIQCLQTNPWVHRLVQ